MKTGDAKTELSMKKDTLYAKMRGEIDHHTAKSVREEIDKALYFYRPTQLYLSLGGVSFMDSSGLGLILGRVAVAENVGCHIYLTDIPPRVNRIFQMAGIHRVPTLTLVSTKKENA